MKRTKKIILCLVLFIIIIAIKTKVNATEISVSPSQPKVGDRITVTVKVPNVHTVDVTANISGVVSGSIKVVGGDMAGNAKTYTNSATYECTKEGTISINISNDSTAVLNGNYVKVGASKNVTVSKKSETTNNSTNSNNTSDHNSNISSDATLKNLGIRPNDFSGFRKATTSYSVTVPKNVDKVTIYATATNSKATVTGTGTKTLKTGKNTFNIKVTAEDKKTTKTYTLTITRKSEDEVSKDATLTNLGIRPKEYDFTGFKPGITSYNVSVPNDVEKITIYATAKSEKSVITGSGSKTLKVGVNKCEIKVTAEDKKTTKTYVINVTRKEKEEKKEEEKKQEEKKEEKEEKNQEEEKKDDKKTITYGLKDIKIENAELSPVFSPDIYSYKANLPSGTENIRIDTETTSDNIEVEVAGNTNLKEGENIITILVHNKKDDTTSTYQIAATVENKEINLTIVNNELKDAQRNAKIQEWIIKGTIIAIVVLIIIYLVQRYKLGQDEFEEEDEDENENEDEYKNDNENEDEYENMKHNNSYFKEEKTNSTSDDLRNIGLFDNTQKIEFEDYDERPKRNKRYKGRRYK